ncbi:hypothetical protein ACFUAC_33715 [Streptomyces sp. NPDC057148]|uniref:hypothetical protein n=1 Tax=unclassified Streptomyces TaxID=2593676 RepID=UPI003634F3D0
MTEHLADDVLARLARTASRDRRDGRHLDACPDCRVRLAAWRDIGTALRAEEAGPEHAPPPFDALLGPVLAPRSAAAPADAACPAAAREAAGPRALVGRLGAGVRSQGPERSLRTAWQLVGRQAALMPKAWAPLSAGGFVGAALLASAQETDRFALRLFGAVVVLLVTFGALAAALPRRDPRHELLFTLPVSPGAVFLARLTVVLSADLAMAMACSALVDGPGWWPVVSSWLGQSLLAASLALALAVRHGPAPGAAAGGAVWLLGVTSGPQGLFSTPVGAMVDALLSTTPWTVALSAALLAWAAGAMRAYAPPEAAER